MLVFPIPSCPFPFPPMAYTTPDLPKANICVVPEVISIISSGNSISSGQVSLFIVPNPQTVPFERRAIVKSFPFTTFAETFASLLSTIFTHAFFGSPVLFSAIIRHLPIFSPVIL